MQVACGGSCQRVPTAAARSRLCNRPAAPDLGRLVRVLGFGLTRAAQGTGAPRASAWPPSGISPNCSFRPEAPDHGANLNVRSRYWLPTLSFRGWLTGRDPKRPANWRRSPAQTGPLERVRIGRPARNAKLTGALRRKASVLKEYEGTSHFLVTASSAKIEVLKSI